MAAIYAMWLRQIKKYWRSKPRMLGSLGQPILFLVALGFGFSSIVEKSGGGNYIQFLAPGVIAMSVLFTAMFSGIEVIWDRQFGFLKETLVSPSSRFQIFVGRTLGGATVSTIQGIVVLLISMLIGFRPISLALIPISIVIMFLLALIFTSLGTAIAAGMEDMQAFPLIINFIIMPLFFLSGSLFPLKTSSVGLRIVAYLNPLSYCVDALRDSLTGISYYGLTLDAIVIGFVLIAINYLGVKLFSKIQV